MTVREQFQEWVSTQPISVATFTRTEAGPYVVWDIEKLWMSWQASRNAALEPLAGVLAAASVGLHMFTNSPASTDSERRMIFRIDPQAFLQIREIEKMVADAILALKEKP